jgi:DNA-binding transcriptional MerR regulator
MTARALPSIRAGGLEIALNPAMKPQPLLQQSPKEPPMETTATRETSAGYSIGDVARICDVPSHTIRFWEKEFGEYIQPARTQGKQRRYQEGTIQKILRIRKLLWTDGYSIHGAKRLLAASNAITFQSSDTVLVPDPHQLAMNIARFVQQQLTMANTEETSAASRNVA